MQRHYATCPATASLAQITPSRAQQPQDVVEDISEKDMEIDYEAASDEELRDSCGGDTKSRRRNGSDWAS